MPETGSNYSALPDFSFPIYKSNRTYKDKVTSVPKIGSVDSASADRLHVGKFVGVWYYAKPPKFADPDGMYRPVYIDMEIRESRGEVKGKYSARYVVGAQPISPFVEFEFSGIGHEPAADLGWSASGGAVGRVRLTLLSARSLQVNWNADKAGEEMGLASGTATLVRRVSP